MSKKSKEKTEVEYNVRDIVLAKVRGYPPWPGMIVEPDSVNASVQRERPKGKSFCVRFFPAGDHSWLQAKDMSPLERSAMENYVANPPKKSEDLLAAYRIALDPAKWEEEKAAAASAAADAEADMDVDQLDGEDDGSGSKGRKRKRGAPAKKGGAGDAKAKRRGGKKNGLSAENVESEDDGAGDDNGRNEGGSKRKKTDKEDEDAKWAHLKEDAAATHIRTVRHTLQRAFLRKNALSEADMEESDKLFKELEEKELSIEYLSYSKIGKVMRHIASLEEEQIPGADRHGFRKRAGDLVARWHKILGTKAPLPAAANGGGTTTRRARSEVQALEQDTGLAPDAGDLTVMDDA